jgi:hypothetical protein
MAAFKSELHSVEEVLNFFELRDAASYRIYAGNSVNPAYCRDEYIGENQEMAVQQLAATLQALKANVNNTNQYLLQVIHKVIKASKDANKPVDFVNVTFQLNGVGGVVGAVGVPTGNDYMLQQLIEMQKQNQIAIVNLQNTIIDLHQQKIEDVETDIPENKLGSLGSIAGQLLSNPNIQEMLANKIIGFLTPKNNGTINGVPKENNTIASNQDELIILGIQRLQAVNPQLGQDLNLLADMAETNKMQFNMLLSMLRK